MNDWHKDLLRQNLVKFKDDLELPEVIAYLMANDVLKTHHYESLVDRRDDTRHERAERLILQLMKLGPDAFLMFYESLAESGQWHLAELIEDGIDPDRRRAPDDNRAPPKPTASPSGTNLPVVKSMDDLNLLFPIQTPHEQGIPTVTGVQSTKRPEQMDADTKKSLPLPPTFDPIEHYRNFTSPKGLALIINNVKFDNSPDRSASVLDAQEMERLLREFDYKCTVHTDLTAQNMLDVMKSFASDRSHVNHDSAVVCVMTHGEYGKLMGVDDEVVDIVAFVKLLDANHCADLREKPKLFFLQACRSAGMDTADGPTVMPPSVALQFFDRDRADAKALKKRIPADADIFIGYSTTPYRLAYLRQGHGSWYFQSIVHVFRQWAHCKDLLTLMTKVNDKVASDYMAMTQDNQLDLQMPDPCSRLRKKFYFYVGLSDPLVDESVEPDILKKEKKRKKCCCF